MTENTVAVVIAAWRAESTLARAIESAQNQTVPVEIIVIDDASPDGTLALAQRMAAEDPRITVLAQKQNGGPAKARNRAIAQTNAAWITVLDSDDFMARDRLEKLLALALQHDADFIADDLYKVSEDDQEGPRTRMFSDDPIGEMWLTTTSFVNANLSAKHGGRRELGFLKPLMSRAFLQENDLTYADMRLGEDFVLYANALANGAKFLVTDPAGYVAVVRPGSLSGWHPTESHAELMAADDALLARPDLPADARAALKAHKLEQHKKWAWRCLIDAVRDRKLGAALRCFKAPLPVALDLTGKFTAEISRRVRGVKPAN